MARITHIHVDHEPALGFVLTPMWPETAQDLMTPHPRSVKATATVAEVARVLTEAHFSGIPVVGERNVLVGVVTHSDIVRHLSDGKDSNVPIGEVMTPDVWAVTLGVATATVIDQMVEHGIHRVFVVENDILVGVVSAFDIVRRMRM